MAVDIWSYGQRDANVETSKVDLTGFGVEARDGSIGKIDEASSGAGGSYLVVDTGPWIFGKKVMVPAGVIERIDVANERVYVHRFKDEIKHAPEFDVARRTDQGYRTEIESYYRPTETTGHSDWDTPSNP